MVLCDLPFHHIEVACREIERELSIVGKMGYKKASDVFVDERQGACGCLVEAEGQPRLERLENHFADGPATSCLIKGMKSYHLAYESKEIKTDVARLGGHPICPVVAATYFKSVCFLAMPNAMICELVQLKDS